MESRFLKHPVEVFLIPYSFSPEEGFKFYFLNTEKETIPLHTTVLNIDVNGFFAITRYFLSMTFDYELTLSEDVKKKKISNNIFLHLNNNNIF